MNHTFTYIPKDNTCHEISKCPDLLKGGKAIALNITIDSKEAMDHFEWFKRQLFLADLFDIHGIFLKGALNDDQLQATANLYSKTKFSFLGHYLFPNTVSLTDLTTNDIKEECEEQPLSNNIRTIICWNGDGQLAPDDQMVLKFEEVEIKGSVIQVQKVIQTDFTGSNFGINTLNPGEVGTVSLLLEKDIEKVPYIDNHSNGFFVIMDAGAMLQLGIGIIIKE